MCFQFFLLVQYSEFMFCTNSLFLNLGNIFSSCLGVCTCNHFFGHLSTNIWSIHLAEIFCTFKIYFKIKCNHDIAICQQLWIYQESCICHHFQLFPWHFRQLPSAYNSQRSARLCWSSQTLCQSEISFSIYQLIIS